MLRFLRTLRGRLAFITLLATVPVYGMLLADYFQNRRLRVNEVRMDALRAAQLIAQRQEELILETRTVLATLAQTPDLRGHVEGGRHDSCALTLSSALQEFPLYTSFALSDIHGDSICSVPPLDQPIDSSDRIWFQAVVKNNDFELGDYQIGRITGKQVLVAATPVRARSGAVGGVLAAAIDLGELANAARRIPLPDESVVMMLDREGTVLARDPDPAHALGRKHPAIDTVLAARGHTGTAVTRGIDGVTRLYAFYPMQERSKLFGFALVGIRDDVAFAPIQKALLRDLLSLLVVTSGSVLAVVLVSRRLILRKSAAILEFTHRLAKEDFGARTGLPHGPDEFGQLAGALDRVACELQSRRDALEKARERERLLEMELRHLQKMEALGSLVGGVAHDFNNMLTAVIGNVQMVMEEVERDSAVAGSLREVLEVADRCSTLTRQLLTFSRKQETKSTRLNLNEVVAGLTSMLTRLIGPQADLRFERAEGLWSVSTDRGQIEQVIVNLVINSRDAMPAGGAILIETSNVSLDEAYAANHLEIKPGDYVILAVTDSGDGMDQATRERIFEPFFTTKKDKGTGLGLATVYGIVKQHHGAIYVYSEVGVGTTFKIYLPRSEASGPPASQTLPEERVPEKSVAGAVLVVEDQESIRMLVQKVLEAAGHSVVVAQNASQAEELFSRNADIELLVTDFIMPGRTGLELYKDLAKARPGLKVLFMSGYTDASMIQNGGLSGGSFLSKPFSPSDLLEKVRWLLKQA